LGLDRNCTNDSTLPSGDIPGGVVIEIMSHVLEAAPGRCAENALLEIIYSIQILDLPAHFFRFR
jgi:hypothetical protein